MRVLLAEDDADLRDAMTEILCLEGFDVDPVASGERVLEHLIAQSPPDVLLLDLSLPGMSGEEVVAAREGISEPVRGIPLVVMTGDRDRVPLAGACAHLVKPFEYDDLVEALRRAVASA